MCFNRSNRSERLSTNNSRAGQKRWLLTTGDVLFSDEANPMLRIVDDSVGIHHASAGCCSDPVNFLRYGVRGTRNCLDNLTLASSPLGLTSKDIPGAFCPFMNVVQAPGRLTGDLGTDVKSGRSHRSARGDGPIRRDL